MGAMQQITWLEIPDNKQVGKVHNLDIWIVDSLKSGFDCDVHIPAQFDIMSKRISSKLAYLENELIHPCLKAARNIAF